jgi:hypothetical protein
MRSRSSRRRVPTSRSQIAFMRGAWTAVRRTLVPAAWKTAPNAAVKFDPRSRIRNLTSSNRSPKLRARLRACCTVHSPVGLAVTPPMCIRRLPCSMNTRTCSLLRNTVSTCRKSTATTPAAWACRNCRQLGPERRGAGSMPAACRISHTVDGATVTPSFMSSPWIRRCPRSGFSLARRTTSRAMPGFAAGVPACVASSCRTSPPPACGARPAASLASPGRPRPSACVGRVAPTQRARPGRPTHTAPGRRAAAVPRSRAGEPAAQHPSFASSPRNTRTTRLSTRHVST